jgi:TonB-dependent starch-binding outer membrane protein SusC
MEKTSLRNQQGAPPVASVERPWRKFLTSVLHGSVSLVAALLILSSPALAQNAVKGKVQDEAGNAMPGVNIIVKGTSQGTTTDSDGLYNISIEDSNTVLVFSFIGYSSQEVSVGGRTTIDVSLSPSAEQLSEVVVVGYGTQKKSDITGAMVQLSEQSIREVPVANISQALQGRVAGVDIQTTSSRPGSSPVIRIRGSRSLGNTTDVNNPNPPNNDPLIVVDGIPFSGSINDLNPSDIVSMDILKDASATAIYGSRGSNGVILITTRQGKRGKPVLTYDGYYGTNSVVGKYDLNNGVEFDAFRKEAIAAGAAYAPTADEAANLAAGNQTDWQDEMFQKGYITNHSISAAGGTDDTQYALSAGYFKQTTVMPGQAYARYSLSGRIDQNIGKRVKIGLSTQNTLNINDGENANPMFQLLTLSPLYNAYNADGSVYGLPATGSIDAVTRNPLLLRNADSWQQQRRRLRTFNALYGEVKILEGLKYRINIGLDFFNDNYGHYYASETPFQNGAANTAQVNNGNSASYTVENLILYEKIFAAKHKVNFTGLFSGQDVESYTSQMSVQDLPANYTLYYNPGLANTVNSLNGNYQRSGLISYMGRLNYGYEDKYLLTLTVRRDGSSRLAQGNQYFNYPAAAVAWNIQREEFMNDVPIISNLKLRIGAGQTSNQAIPPYRSLGELGKVPYNFGPSAGAYGYNVTSMPNPNLSWEFTTTYNAGLDFGLFTNRLSGSLEFYKSLTTDILQQRALPPTSGVSSVLQNIGKTENKGIELTLSGVIMESKTTGGFNWSADVNWFLNRAEITELGSGVTIDVNNGWYVGQPIDAIFDYKKIGIWQLGEETAATTMGGFRPGNIKVEDINADGKIDANDRTVLGSLQPKWQGGLTSRFSYKGFNLDVVMFAKVGGMLVSTLYQANQNSPYNTLEGRRNGPKVDYWTPTNPTDAYPRPGQAQQPVFGSTLGYFDASYLKIRAINLSYNLPQAWLDKTELSGVRVYVQAQNPFKAFMSDYVKAGGLDPETTGFGGSNAPGWNNRVTVQPNTPPVRQIIFGVNIRY